MPPALTSELARPLLAIAFLSALLGAQPVQFVDESARIPFIHRSVPFGGFGLGGAVWFDFDDDADLDLLITNGKTQNNGLFRNEGNGTFTEVGAQAGIQNGVGNMTALAADIDNDGHQDLFLTSDGGGAGGVLPAPVRLYHNLGNGTFADITTSSGVVRPETDGSAAFADIDNDGYLDLFICGIGALPNTGPQHRNKLYRNNGNLTFTDISASSGVNTMLGACATFFSDYDADGWIDLFVANCNDVTFAPTPIELFRNNGNLTFTDVGLQAGLYAGGFWMGCGPADYDNDGDIDIFVTNTGGGSRPHRLYRNNGNGTYTNVAVQAQAAFFRFGWGCAFNDFDNDGYADIFFAGSLAGNGFNTIGPNLGNPGTFLINNQNGVFIDYTSTFPVNMSNHFTSGVAHGDYDNDGFSDIVVAVEQWGLTSGQPFLFRNQGNGNGWISLDLEGTTSNRDAVGARVRVVAGSLQQTKEIYAGTSFASMDSQKLVFGLGLNPATSRIEVTWPSGRTEIFPNLMTTQGATLVEGQGSGAVLCGTTPLTLGANNSVSVASVAANAGILVLVDTAVGSIPIGAGGSLGHTQLAFSPQLFPIADPTALFGPSLAPITTDAGGAWTFSTPIPSDPALLSLTLYSEAFVFQAAAPNGFFHQSNLLTVTFQ